LEIDSKINKNSNSKINNENEIPKNFKLGESDEIKDKENSQPFSLRRKSRIVLNDLKFNTKEQKSYAMDFESLYDNFEREVDFVDKIDSQNSQNSEKDFSGNLRKRSSIIPFGKKAFKKDELTADKFNNEIEEFFQQENNCLKLNRKSSILGILESNLNNKKNLNECDQIEL